jgi:hypothetical protein
LARSRRAFSLVISCEGRRAAMTMFSGLDVVFKRTAICVVNGQAEIVWRGITDSHPEALSWALASEL